MASCANCGAELPRKSRYCARCGHPAAANETKVMELPPNETGHVPIEYTQVAPRYYGVTPTTLVDITPAIEKKRAAMGEMKAQQYLQTYYAQRAEQRGNHARRASGNQDVRFAEAFQRVIPQVVTEL